ncbi:MAG: LUD domain-containing protein [Verrucomicrobiae bacterium]|nr:LUD domain-containing protein [Verrucomicrobiae bacterium]NNJ44308.1 LUD domain-containing protein [Akkermansiaceae bacterium]
MSRSSIFSKIKQATDAVAQKTPLPDYDVSLVHSAPKLEGANHWETFSRNFSAVNGKPMDSIDALITLLKETENVHGYCDPALMDEVGEHLVKAGMGVETEYDRTRYEDYTFGITRATGAIAESGTLILNDEQTSDRLAALSPWVHVGVLQNEDILRTIPDAIDAFGSSPNIIWATGPSKTADVEGILIEGVHGPGEEIALLLG